MIISKNHQLRLTSRLRQTFLMLFVISFLLAAISSVYAQTAPIFTRTESMIAMRDGVKLNTQVFSPTRTDEKFHAGRSVGINRAACDSFAVRRLLFKSRLVAERRANSA